VVQLVGVREVGRERADVATLPFRSGADRLGGREGFPSDPEILRDRLLPELAEAAHRDPPAGDGAFRVALGDRGEGLLRGSVPERVQHRDRAIEVLLDFRCTGGGERHPSERRFVAGGVFVVLCRGGKGQRQQGGEGKLETSPRSHPMQLLSSSNR
jgi:hypothetical protein